MGNSHFVVRPISGLPISSEGKQYDALGRPVNPERWGIRASQIRVFLDYCKKHVPEFSRPNFTVRHLVKLIRKCFTDGRSVALTFNASDPLVINVLISHCWNEHAETFLTNCLKGLQDDDAAFICFLSQYQGTKEEIDWQVKQGSTDIEQGVFARILKSVKKQKKGRMHIISCDEVRDTGLYGRLWCVWELYQAMKIKLRILVDDDHPLLHRHNGVEGPENNSEAEWTPEGAQIMGGILHKFFGTHIFLWKTGETFTPEFMNFNVRNARCGPPESQMEEDELNIRAAIENRDGWDLIRDNLVQFGEAMWHHGRSFSSASSPLHEVQYGLQTTRVEMPYQQELQTTRVAVPMVSVCQRPTVQRVVSMVETVPVYQRIAVPVVSHPSTCIMSYRLQIV